MALFPDLQEAELFPGPDELPHEFRETAFLWTWTFADIEPRQSAKEAMKRWTPHARWLRDSGKMLLRALERGGKRGSYHFHAITHQRWDVREIRAHAEKCGFGRINVKVIPRDRVGYIAKYLGKPGRFPIPKGVRLWACIGYEGVKQNDVRCHVTDLTVNVPDPTPVLRLGKRWTVDGIIVAEFLERPNSTNDLPWHYMNITKENTLQIAQLVAQGNILCVAEYRTCSARKLEFEEEKKGVATGKQVVRKIVEHGVEVGNEQITVSEWLADDADIAAVKAPAAKGEPVLIVISQFSKKYGITAKSIHSLSNFNGKLA